MDAGDLKGVVIQQLSFDSFHLIVPVILELLSNSVLMDNYFHVFESKYSQISIKQAIVKQASSFNRNLRIIHFYNLFTSPVTLAICLVTF